MLKNLHFLLLALLVASCTTDDTTDGGGTQLPVIVAANPGNGRVEVVWNPNDSDAAYTQIWADDELISTEYVSSDSSEVTRTVSLDGGQSYTFTIQNVAEDGTMLEKSLGTKVEIYDDSWGEGLEPCEILSISFDDELGGVITWEDPEDGSYLSGNTVFYVDWEGNNYSKYVAIGDGTSYFEGANLDTEFTYISHYLPVSNAIDDYVSAQSGDKAFEVELNGDGQRVLIVKHPRAMVPYFSRSNVCIELEQGEYWVTPDDVTDGYYDTFCELTEEHDLFQASGDYSTYDFGNSTIYIDTDIFDMKGMSINTIHTIGNWNTVKNMKMVDIGPMEDAPSNGYNNVTMDGTYNVLENISIHSTGSYPYGYGYLFGKGGSYTIAHDKHCCVFNRGVFNLFTDGFIEHKAFGHCYYVQSGIYTMIRNTYVHGAIGSTDWVLADKRSRYSADAKYNRDRPYDVGYLTDFGYVVPPYETVSLVEEGIRCYESGVTLINGELSYPQTGAAVAIGCTVDMARNPVHFTQISTTNTIAAAFADAEYPAPEWWTSESYSSRLQAAGTLGADSYVERVTCIDNQHGGVTINGSSSCKSLICDNRVSTKYGAMAALNSYTTGYITLLPFELDTKVQGYQVISQGTSGISLPGNNNFVFDRDDTDLAKSGWGYERIGIVNSSQEMVDEKRRISFTGNSNLVISFIPFDAYFTSGTTGNTIHMLKSITINGVDEPNYVFNGDETEIDISGYSSSSAGSSTAVGNNTVVLYDTEEDLRAYLETQSSTFENVMPTGLPYVYAYSPDNVYPRDNDFEY